MDFSVRVVYDWHGEETLCTGKEVTAFFFMEHPFLPGSHLSEYTDDEGVAYFTCDWDTDEEDIQIGVGSMELMKYHVEDGDQITVNCEL
jgi:hypothetical protein